MTDDLRDVSEFTAVPRAQMVEGPRDLMTGPTRTRAKVERMADRLVAQLDRLDVTSFFNPAPHHDARVIMSVLDSDPLTPVELQLVLDELKRRGRLSEFLHLLREDEIRDYLKMMGVPWTYFVRNWVVSAGDSTEVLRGFVAGVAQSAADIFVLLSSVLKSAFVEQTLREDAARLWLAFAELFDLIKEKDFAEVVGESFNKLLRDFDTAIYERRFFEAGRQLGHFVGVIVPLLAALPGAARAGIAAARAFAHLIDDLIEVSMNLVRYLRLELKTLYEGFENLGSPQLAFATSGLSGEVVPGGGAIVLTQGDKAIGKIGREAFMMRADEVARQASATGKTLAQMDPDEAEEFLRTWTDSPLLRAKFGKTFAEELDSLVTDAIVAMKHDIELYGPVANQGQYGKLIHEKFSDLVRAFHDDVPFVIRSESRLADFAEIPEKIRNMPVRKFLGDDTSGLGKAFLDGKVGDKIPDLVLTMDDTIFIWDLTTQGRLAHQAKTLFLRKVFDTIPGKNVVVGESYYRYYTPNNWD